MSSSTVLSTCKEVNVWQEGCSSVEGSGDECDPHMGEQRFVATQGQQFFQLTAFEYAPGTNSLAIHNEGLLVDPLKVTELSPTTFFLNAEIVNAGDIIVANALTGVTSEVEILISNLSTFEIVLNDGQQVVLFPDDVPVLNSSIHINGFGVDDGRLVEDVQYTVNGVTNTVTLVESYPTGTILILTYNDEATGIPPIVVPDNTLWVDFTSIIGTTQHTVLTIGATILANYFDSALTLDSGATFAFTGVTIVGKAGNVPDADGFFYDADGKQFEINGVPNVRQYGAVGDTIADDTVAIQIAVGTMTANASLFFPATPAAYYKITTAIELSSFNGAVLFGEGKRVSVVRQVTAATDAFIANTTDASNGQGIRDMWIQGANAARYGFALGHISFGWQRSFLHNVRFSGFTGGAGIFTQSSTVVDIQTCDFDGNKDGILETSGSASGPNAWNINGCNFDNQTGYAVNVYQLSGWNFTGNAVQANLSGGILVTHAGGAINISGNYFEHNRVLDGPGEYFDIFLGSVARFNAANITGNYINGNNTGTQDYIPLRFKIAAGITIDANRLNVGSKFIRFEDSALIESFRIGSIAFNNGAIDLTTGPDGTFQNIPSNFYSQERNSSIELYSSYDGILKQSFVRHGQLTLELAAYTTEVTGTGEVTRSGSGMIISTGTAAGSTALAYIGSFGWSRNLGQGSLQYDNEVILELIVSNVASNTANGNTYLMITPNGAIGAPTDDALGFRIDGNALFGIVHNGTVLTSTDLNTSLSSGANTILRIRYTGQQILWYVNGVLVGTNGTSVQLPGGADIATFVISTENNADSARARIGIYDVQYRVVQ